MALGAEGGTYWSETITLRAGPVPGEAWRGPASTNVPSAVSEIDLVGDVSRLRLRLSVSLSLSLSLPQSPSRTRSRGPVPLWRSRDSGVPRPFYSMESGY